MKHRIFLIIITLCTALSCHRDDERQALILLTVSGPCVADLDFYRPDSTLYFSKVWDCSESKRLVFYVDYSGSLTIEARAASGGYDPVRLDFSLKQGEETKISIEFF
jgi:hypothetical protein